MCAASFGVYSCSDGYNLDTEQPSGLNSIYGYLEQQGNYKNFLLLIEDLGEKEVLSKSGSKTLFAADDEAFAEFFENNSWGVSSYDQLTEAQKKMILRSSMIDSPYTTTMLSHIQGPIEGEAMRRTASNSIYDSVTVFKKTDAEIPTTDAWKALSKDEFVLFKDASGAAPMIHFMPRFLEQNFITGTDVDFLYNDPANTYKSGDAYVNDAKIVESNIFCKNGFVHKVDRVITPLDNMAEIIRKNEETTHYSSLLERFSAPIYVGQVATDAYNENKGVQWDSVYAKRYFSNLSMNGEILEQDNAGNTFDALLKFDPGWNTYYTQSAPMMQDMAVMLVPTDSALNVWWNTGGGKVLKDYYGDWDSVPNSVLNKLINVNMLQSFVASVPSKFKNVLDDANMEMGLSTDSIKYVQLGGNGAVYVTRAVYTPTVYSSVLFPAVINETMSVFNKAIERLDYAAYLNSMVATYSFFIPTNNGLLSYVDPVSFGQNRTLIWEFHYDPTATSAKQIYADTYEYVQQEDGTWAKGEFVKKETPTTLPRYGVPQDKVYHRLRDLLDNSIVIGSVQPGKKYYQTKGYSFVKVGGNIDVEGQMTVAGGWQLDQNTPVTVTDIYNMRNGKAYILDGAPIMTSTNALSDVLAANPEFSEFNKIISMVGGFSTKYSTTSGTSGRFSSSKLGNLIYVPAKLGGTESINYLMNGFHYTVYAPTNAAMEEAYALGLPTEDMFIEADSLDEAGETEDSAAHIRKVILDFVKYHVQLGSVFADEGFNSGTYETARTNSATGRPYMLRVTPSSEGISVEGVQARKGQGEYSQPSEKQNVLKDKIYNTMIREYWNGSSGFGNSSNANSTEATVESSNAVVHSVDHPLLYDKTMVDVVVDTTTMETVKKAYQFIYRANDVYDSGEEEEEE